MKKTRAEHVFTFCDPGDRLHMQRMNGENGCHKRAPPKAPVMRCSAINRRRQRQREEGH